MTFRSLYRQGFARVAACTTPTALADPAANAAAILSVARQCHEHSAAVAVFPELALSAYAIDDLLLQDALLDAVEATVDDLVARSSELMPLLLVGAPVRHAGRLYNAALAIHRGRLLGVVPKIHLPNYREFYERRHFASGDGTEGGEIRLGSHLAPFGPDLLFAASDVPGLVVHAEICEDFWVPVPPSAVAALAGATVLANLSASNITIGKADTRRLLCLSQSARCLAAYLYAAAGTGKSTTDLAWDGQAAVFETGVELAATDRFPSGERIAVADIDLDLLRQERLRMGTFDDNRRRYAVGVQLPESLLRAGAAHGRPRPFPPRRPVPVRSRRSGASRPGLLRSLQHPGFGPGSAPARERHRSAGYRRLGRPGFHPGTARGRAGVRSAGAAARQSVRLHHARLRHQ